MSLKILGKLCDKLDNGGQERVWNRFGCGRFLLQHFVKHELKNMRKVGQCGTCIGKGERVLN